MAKKNRKCLLCGTEYTYCSGCQKDQSKPAWMAEFHEENCKTIFKTCVSFYMNHLTKSQAKEILSNCDLSQKSTFTSSVQSQLAEIFAEYEKVVEKKPTAKKPAPVAPKAAKTPVVEKTEITPIIEKIETTPAPEKAEIAHEVVNKTEEK